MTPPGEIDRVWVDEYEREEMVNYKAGELIAFADLMVIKQDGRSSFAFFEVCVSVWPGFEQELLYSALDDQYFANLAFPPEARQIAVVLLFAVRNMAGKANNNVDRERCTDLAKTYLVVFKDLLIGGRIKTAIDANRKSSEEIATAAIRKAARK